ncbi:MAG TPA: flagellar basal body rod protein FlgC [Gammaproteobacteria bacterium]|nr:flagellar basal body rod protein FlgC [Gammaproteobacteria bacterium]
MSLFKVLDIAGSGMSAQALRLNTTASNMANAETVSSSTNETYRARYPVFAATLNALGEPNRGAGVDVKGIVESQSPLRKEFAPNHPQADEDGYIYKPNVNMVEEMANMISASRAYQGNVEVAKTSKQLLMRTLSLGE